MYVVENIIVKKQCFFLYLFLERQVEDVAKCCCTGQKSSVLVTDTTNNLCDMWVADSCYQNKRLIENASGHHPVLLGPALFHFTKDDQTFTWLALKLQASNPETRKLKRIGFDMEMLSSMECSPFFKMCQSYSVFATWNSGMRLKLESFSQSLSIVKMKRYLKWTIIGGKKFNGFCKIYAFLWN